MVLTRVRLTERRVVYETVLKPPIHIPVPAAGRPTIPASWYYALPLAQLRDGPASVRLLTDEFVAFQTESGRVVMLDGKCVHLGAQLAKGCVVGERIRCPFHEWEYGADGRCERIPASAEVPEFARQRSYPTAVLGGQVFFFNRPEACFDVPFFAGRTADELLPAKPFDFELEVPWYMVAANGFDLQHFRTAHDRTLLGEPEVSQPSDFSRRICCHFDVSGTGLRDRLTRAFSGPKVKMTVTSHCGTVIYVSAEFRRTTSYGMVAVTPVDEVRSRIRTIVWVRRSASAAGRMLFDPVDAGIRRSFIRAFVGADRDRSAGIRYTPETLIDADTVLADYLRWIGNITRA